MAKSTHLERRAKELADRVRQLRAQESTQRAAADVVRDAAKAKGWKLSDTGPEAKATFSRIDAAYAAADTLRDQALGVESQLHALLDGAGTGVNPVTSAAQREQLLELHSAMKDKRNAGCDLADVVDYPKPIDQLTDGDEVVSVRREPTRISALMPQRTTTEGTVRYWRQSGAATAAAPVAPGAPKPESNPGWLPVDLPMRKLAHLVDLPTEALADFDDFADVVRTEMLAGLINTENTQVLSGDGTGENLQGLLTTVGILVVVVGVDTEHAAIRKALTALRVGSSFVEPDILLIRPTELELIDLDVGGDGHYTVDTSDGRIWRVRFEQSTQLPTGDALTANLAIGTKFYTREPARIIVDPWSQSGSNLVRVIAEERVGVAVTRPSAICRIDLV